MSHELQAKINEFNDELMKWSETTNGVNVIPTNLPFKLGTEEIDDICFNVNEECSDLLLNRLRAIR